MTKKLGFLVNCERCVGCHTCEMACKNYYQQDPGIRWRKVALVKEGINTTVPVREYISLACNHCEEPACMKVCPVSAYEKREDGIVLHKYDLCIGCKLCIEACPYTVPEYNKDKEKVEKCHMCYEKLDKGEKPACVAGCPLDAIDVIDLNSTTETGFTTEYAGFADPSVTKPSTRFIKPVEIKQIRRD
ncbi:oxidoreductase [Desulfuribacillus stibiiarsenatis]|uniref:Oxidoreductase n=1 Tax=Desulfuribacillus stibiiarsenatis TaxID=1390249 RepID=A0A1E5LA43_9FIRM|nr:4Fe-4S dicluster domain-containing protein [Desulfuribacillus stibiiarsenatis]OEH86889.1 oxidoreductase [Desulfuribacillus stibiiarsenatis]